MPAKFTLDTNFLYFLLNDLIVLSALVGFSYRIRKKENLQLIQYFSIVVALVVYFSILGSTRGYFVKKINGLKEIRITTDKEINSDLENYFFIGQTNEYLIMFNTQKANSIIINKKNVSSFSLKNRFD